MLNNICISVIVCQLQSEMNATIHWFMHGKKSKYIHYKQTNELINSLKKYIQRLARLVRIDLENNNKNNVDNFPIPTKINY